MPLNVKGFSFSVLLTIIFSTVLIHAQTSADVMRERVAKAKAHIAVRNYSAAIYELENIRRETHDQTVHGVVNILLINSFLEQGDYKRAQDFLTELAKKPGASASYLAAAGQVVKGARNQMERYRALGLSVSDPKLPKDAVADVDKMRETLEKVVEQTKILGKDKAQMAGAMALMEEATVARGGLARDNFDANRWKNEAANAREDLVNSRSVVINAVNETPTQTTQPEPTQTLTANTTATTNPANTIENTTENKPLLKPVPVAEEKSIVAKNEPAIIPPVTVTPKTEIKKAEDTTIVAKENPTGDLTTQTRTRRIENTDPQTNAVRKENKIETPNTGMQTNTLPLAVGSLVNFATQKTNPVYPPAAKNMRMTGVVKVELVIDENGQVAEVQNTSGPIMLQRAATDAVKKWKFKPFIRDGQATKATGFVSFNFSL